MYRKIEKYIYNKNKHNYLKTYIYFFGEGVK